MKKFDIIVVGAGAAGSIAAYFGAKNGYHVCLIDGKQRDKIGDKICGDGIGSHIFDLLDIPHPLKGEYLNKMEGVKIYPPDTRFPTLLKDSKKGGYILDRLTFGQRLLHAAVDAGALLFDQTHGKSLIKVNGSVAGVCVKSKTLQETELKANLVIDASGFHTRFRKQVDIPFLTKDIDPNDFIYCYREILRLKNPGVPEKEFLKIYMDNFRAPGGYIWYFPRNEYEINLGFGVTEKFKPQLMDYYQKYVYDTYIGDEPCTKISSRSGLVSICKPLLNGVGDGILFAGDSAMQVNPLTGGGLVSSMLAGFYAIQAYDKAKKIGNFNAQSLWEYNLLCQKSIGAEFAALDLFRLILQKLSNAELNYILKKRIITGEDISGMSTSGKMALPSGAVLGKLIRGLSSPKTLLKLNYIRKQMRTIKALYMNYPPSPRDLDRWAKKVQTIYDNVRERY